MSVTTYRVMRAVVGGEELAVERGWLTLYEQAADVPGGREWRAEIATQAILPVSLLSMPNEALDVELSGDGATLKGRAMIELVSSGRGLSLLNADPDFLLTA